MLAQIRGSNPYEILNDLLVPTCAGDDGKGSVDECPMYVQRLNQCMFREGGCCKRLSRNVSTELALVSGVQDCDRPDWPIPAPLPPPPPPATTPAPCPPGRCVEFVISLPITEDQFILEYINQNTFRRAIAQAAEVPVSAVQITSIQVANSPRRRRLLMDKIQIAVEVTTDDYETAVQVSERLTQDRINQELREAGLVQGLLVKQAQVASCPDNANAPEGSTTATDCACNQGYTGANGGACFACPTGTYKDVSGVVQEHDALDARPNPCSRACMSRCTMRT